MTNPLFNTTDIDRLLGLADQFLEEWAEDCIQSGEPDREYEARQAEWNSVRPLLLAMPEMLEDLQFVYTELAQSRLSSAPKTPEHYALERVRKYRKPSPQDESR